MSTSAVGSALAGIASAQAMFDGAAQAAARFSEPDSDPTAAVVGATMASESFALNVAVLGMALRGERSLIDIFA